MGTHPPAARPVDGVRVPFVDLAPANNLVKDRVLSRLGQTIDRGDFINGEAVDEFERQFAGYCGRAHCVGVSSGLAALRLSLLATKVTHGAGVIVPAGTFAASVEAVVQAGGTPILVDIDDRDYTLDVRQTAEVADRASHLMPVHLYGQLADMHALSRIAERHDLQIVEDACQAHGSRRDGVRPGDRARAAAFSFYPSKNLGAMGDAGALVTDDAELALHARALRVHGETRKYHHDYVGYTARLDTVQAIVLLEKLALLEEWNALRRAAADYYSRALVGIEGLHLPSQPAGSESAWHLYVVRTSQVDRLATFLAGRGIQTGRHYPEPVHLSPAYGYLGYTAGDFPVAEALAREAISLPLFPGITDAQLERVSTAVIDFFGT